jgi:hypothetical protein
MKYAKRAILSGREDSRLSDVTGWLLEVSGITESGLRMERKRRKRGEDAGLR